MSRLSREQQKQRSAFRLLKAKTMSRRDRLINRIYKRSPYYKWTFACRIFFVIIAALMWLTTPVFYESDEQVIANLTYETEQSSGGKNMVVTRTSYYTIVHGSSGSSYSLRAHSYGSGIKIGDRFKAGRNLLMKQSWIWFTDRGIVYTVSDGGRAKFIFSILQVMGLFSLFMKPSYREIRYLNILLAGSLGLLLIYYLA